MRMPADSPLMTAEDVQYVTIPGRAAELVRGRLVVMEPPSTEHGRVQANLLIRIGVWVQANELGVVFGQDTGFKIASAPDTVRGPDIAFASAARAALVPKRGYAEFAPDFVVEIASPTDRAGDLLAKTGEWLQAGTRLVWIIDPERREARVFRADGSVGLIAPGGILEGEDVLLGFRVALDDVLA